MFKYFKEESYLNSLVNKTKKQGKYRLNSWDKTTLDNMENPLERLENKGLAIDIKERRYTVNSYGNLKIMLAKEVTLTLK